MTFANLRSFFVQLPVVPVVLLCGASNSTEINEFCMKNVFGYCRVRVCQSKGSEAGETTWPMSVKPNWEERHL